jgi:hypothetical protein
MTKILKKYELNREYIVQILEYKPQTGEFFWLVPKAMRVNIGDLAGNYRRQSGYVTISIDNVDYKAHHLVWLYHYGVFPVLEIDHIDGNRANNRVDNLREVTSSTNAMNRKMREDCSSGVTGVSLRRGKGRNGNPHHAWVAFWCDSNGKQRFKNFAVIKYGFDTAKQMAISYREARIRELNTAGANYTERHGK